VAATGGAGLVLGAAVWTGGHGKSPRGDHTPAEAGYFSGNLSFLSIREFILFGVPNVEFLSMMSYCYSAHLTLLYPFS
jgi:hypothetical protein